MMRMLMEMVLGFLVLQAAASPRFARQVELDTYDSANYDVDLENLNPDNQDIYDYEDGLTIDEPQIEIGTLAPPDYNYPAPGASLEEEEEEEQEEGLEEEEQEEDQEEGQEEEEQEEGQEEEEQEEGQEEEEQEEEELEEAQEEEELEEAQEEEELEEGQEEEEEQEEEQEIQLKVEEEVQLKPKLIPQGSGDSGILMGPDTQKEEELRLAPIDILHVSGDFGGSVGSGASGESGSSGHLLGSGDLLSSGDLLGSGGSGGSGDLGSGGSGASGASGDILGSGESGDILGSGGSGITMISGEEELILEKIPQEASGDEESGASGDPSASGEAGEPSASGEAGEPSASGEAGEPSASGEAGEPSASGEAGEPSASGEAGEPSASGEDVSGVSAESGVSGEEEGEPIIPIIDKEEELLPATPSPEETEGEIISGASGLEPDFKGMPTCLLCTCLGGSVYCDDLKLSHVPPLPKDTTHFYARYNKITKINKSDFAEMNKLKRIDVTANEISSVADGAFTGLPVLEELIIRENAVAQLPALPVTMTLVDASHNNIGATGIHKEAFKDMAGLLYLYLTDNHIDHIPVPLPDSLRSLHLQRNNIQMMHEDTFCNLKDFNYIRNALEDIRLDGNPLNLSRTPQAYVCLPRVPVGDLI